MLHLSGLVTTTVLNTKSSEVENKNLNLSRKTNYDGKITAIEKNISLLLITINSKWHTWHEDKIKSISQ